MTATDITTPTDKTITNYQRLDFYIDQIATHMDSAYDIFVECCRIAIEEEYLTPQEAWQYVYTKLKDHVAERTLYMWADKALPEGAKKTTKPKGSTKKIATLQSPKQEAGADSTQVNNVNLNTTYTVQEAEVASEQPTQNVTPIIAKLSVQPSVQAEQPGPGEVQGVHNIAPEDYELERLEEYDIETLRNIIRYIRIENTELSARIKNLEEYHSKTKEH